MNKPTGNSPASGGNDDTGGSGVSEPGHGLHGIGWPLDQPLPEMAAGERLVRVIEQHRTALRVHDGQRSHRTGYARLLSGQRHGESVDGAERPGVGDWLLAASDKGGLRLLQRLPRRNVIVRAAAGERYQAQMLAANLDLAVIVMGLDGDFNLRRLERYLALIGSAGVPAMVVLSKADQWPATAEQHAQVQAVAGDSPVLAIDCRDPAQVQPLADQLGPGRTAVLLGSSGAGKSTLSNTLLGQEQQKTSHVRRSDSRGRHTTTTRSLLQLPGGGCLIDSPGMRELKLTGDESLGQAQFADIQALADQCRFRDCQHGHEPGCAVQAAVDSGQLPALRLAHFHKLAAERDQAVAQRLVQQRQARQGSASASAGARRGDNQMQDDGGFGGDCAGRVRGHSDAEPADDRADNSRGTRGGRSGAGR
ncbi:MAG: ribosome small subunit-dependent GTPase A [Xanthomonadales bacterium]|nr:ribosome small subunit-dependent GTPase A [Xanthomonadales bacterium]